MFWSLHLGVVLLSSLAPAQGLQFPQPLAAVSVSKELGFVMLLKEGERMCPVSLSKRDTERVVSAEGHTILQLISQIDTATAVLPPDALARQFDDDDLNLELLEVRVERRPPEESTNKEPPRGESRCDVASAERRAADLMKAISTLGLPLTEDEAVRLLLKYSTRGDLKRKEFSAVVAEIRDETTATDALLKTTLVAGDGRQVEATAFVAFALALRHRAPVAPDASVFLIPDLAFDADKAYAKFPLLQNIDDLKLHGKKLEAHSRNLFNQARGRVESAIEAKDGGKGILFYDDDDSSSKKDPPDNDEEERGSSSSPARAAFQPKDYF